MSGGVGPCKDIGLMKDETEEPSQQTTSSSEEEEETKDLTKKNKKFTITMTGHHRFFLFRQLNALVVMVVLATSGMVAVEDFVFLVFSIMYILFLSKFIFPKPPSPDHPLTEKTTILKLYIFTGILIGLILPVAYIFEGILEGDKEGIKAASPHVFLLSCQFFLEGIVYNSVDFSLPIKIFVSVVYNGRMLVAAMDWLLQEVLMNDKVHGTTRRLHVGRLLALVNLVYWSFNLFGLLVPVYLPRTFRNYYGQKEKL